MPISNLPAALQSMIQEGWLDHSIKEALKATLGFRRTADKEAFKSGIGQTTTFSRRALLPLVTQPTAPLSNSDVVQLTGSNMDQTGNQKVEQYKLAINQYNGSLSLNVVTSTVAIGNQFLLNAKDLTEQAARSIDSLARDELYNTYMGGHTWVSATLGAPASTIHVADVRGFFLTLDSKGRPVSVSGGNTVQVLIGSDVYTLTGVIADGNAPASAPESLTYSGVAGTTVCVNWGAVPGTLTFSSNVSVLDGTAGVAVVRVDAPALIRPDGSLSTLALGASATATLTTDAILQATATLQSNGVAPLASSGLYGFYSSPLQLAGVYRDPAFQSFFRGRPDTPEFRAGALGELLGVEVLRTHQNPVQAPGNGVAKTVHRGIVVGQGALVEADFQGGYAQALEIAGAEDGMITVNDGIAHIVREPIDAAQQIVTQTWAAITGFAAPTDVFTTSDTVPTATAASWKRAVIIESN